MSTIKPDWSRIPIDLLGLIVEKIESIEDYVRFGAVCRSWYTAAAIDCSANKTWGSPWLMLVRKKVSRVSPLLNRRGFYNISGGNVFEIVLPEIRGRRCWGSPYGWLITFGTDLDINLFNPLSRASVPLPQLVDFFAATDPDGFHDTIDCHCYFLNKAIVTASPDSPDCMVFIIYSFDDKLGYTKPGHQVWYPIEGLDQLSDITYFNGKLYACRWDGQVLILDFSSGTQPKTVEFAEVSAFDGRKYLVELGGELCLALRHMNEYEIPGSAESYMVTSKFEVYKMEKGTEKWSQQVLSLGDRCLFLGTNYSFAARASGLLKPNCIYFTDDSHDCYEESRGCDMGIYDMQMGEIAKYGAYAPQSISGSVEGDLYCDLCPPIWITPSLRLTRKRWREYESQDMEVSNFIRDKSIETIASLRNLLTDSDIQNLLKIATNVILREKQKQDGTMR